MSFDFEILVMNQLKAIDKSPISKICIKSEYEEGYGRFPNTHPFISSLPGVWYSIGVEDDDFITTLPIIDTDFNCVSDNKMPFWIKDEEILENYTILSVYEEYKTSLVDLIDYLISLSPTNTLLILTRFQGGDTETVQGVISLAQYKELLINNQLVFNVCYIVQM